MCLLQGSGHLLRAPLVTEVQSGAIAYYETRNQRWNGRFLIKQHVGGVAVPDYLHNDSWTKKCSSRGEAVVVANALAAHVATMLVAVLPMSGGADETEEAAAATTAAAAAAASHVDDTALLSIASAAAAASVAAASAGNPIAGAAAGADFVLKPESMQALLQFAADCTASKQTALQGLEAAQQQGAHQRCEETRLLDEERLLQEVTKVRSKTLRELELC